MNPANLMKFTKVFKNLPSVTELQKKMKQLNSAIEFDKDTDVASFTHVHSKIHGYFASNSVLKDELEELMATRGKAIFENRINGKIAMDFRVNMREGRHVGILVKFYRAI
jgi:hypothetical protein